MPIPYFTIHDGAIPLPFTILGHKSFPIHPFGVLVATGVIIGSNLAVKRADKRGLDRLKMESFISWILLFGFVLSHVLDDLMYRPQEVLDNPFHLLMIHRGISSFGGFVGGIVGALAWKASKKERILPYLEQVGAVFPIAWIFGRSGCTVAHDHIGRLSTSPFAVAFPTGARLDLGLLELMATIPIAAFIWWFARKPRPEGAILGVLGVIYAPIRFQLDSLRATDIVDADARYAGMTPGQWLSIVLLVAGVAMLAKAYAFTPKPKAPVEA